MLMGPHLTVEQRQLARRLHGRGLSLREIGRQVGCSHEVVRAVVRRESKRPVRSDLWQPGPGRLSLADREEISLGLRDGDSFTAIAARLGKAVSTVSREVVANGGRGDYRAWRAHQRARDRARRPKTPKLTCARLAAQVTQWLQDWWSPQQIASRLRMEFADDPMMQVSHETIYQALFVQGRGELRRELARCLRTGRVRRRARRRGENTGQLRDMVMISDRPAEANDRAVPGHWEGDLLIGADCRSAVGTLVERTSRYVMLLHLPHGRGADGVDQAMRQAISTLPDQLRRSITWDQGKEMAHHARFAIATGIQVYFCDPHKPWQRGSNENTNGLLRQYMPKGTDLSVHTAEDLARYARSLNDRPRKTLGYLKPSERLAEILAHTG
jgi:transposase, IS30 family